MSNRRRFAAIRRSVPPSPRAVEGGARITLYSTRRERVGIPENGPRDVDAPGAPTVKGTHDASQYD